MTFRIDYVDRHDGVWEFRIKGIRGGGVYGSLYTDDQGRWLSFTEGFALMSAGNMQLALSRDEFVIPAEASEQEACRLLTAALVRLGWGPQVDRIGRQVSA